MEKYNLNEKVYIVYSNKVIECKIIEITKNIRGIIYELLAENVSEKIKYSRSESEVFKDKEEANNYIKKLHYDEKVTEINIEICNYQKWVSTLDIAIQKHENCKTDIEITLISNETNSSDKVIFGVTNTGSKQLLENIREYYKKCLYEKIKKLKELEKNK